MGITAAAVTDVMVTLKALGRLGIGGIARSLSMVLDPIVKATDVLDRIGSLMIGGLDAHM